mgnify:CR=1 FL=1
MSWIWECYTINVMCIKNQHTDFCYYMIADIIRPSSIFTVVLLFVYPCKAISWNCAFLLVAYLTIHFWLQQGVQKVLDVRFHPKNLPQLVCSSNAVISLLIIYLCIISLHYTIAYIYVAYSNYSLPHYNVKIHVSAIFKGKRILFKGFLSSF